MIEPSNMSSLEEKIGLEKAKMVTLEEVKEFERLEHQLKENKEKVACLEKDIMDREKGNPFFQEAFARKVALVKFEDIMFDEESGTKVTLNNDLLRVRSSTTRIFEPSDTFSRKRLSHASSRSSQSSGIQNMEQSVNRLSNHLLLTWKCQLRIFQTLTLVPSLVLRAWIRWTASKTTWQRLRTRNLLKIIKTLSGTLLL